MPRARRRRRASAALLLLTAALVALPARAAAAPPCENQVVAAIYLVQGQSTLESVIVDYRGRLFFTNSDSVLRLDARGVEPKKLADIEEPGGLAFDSDGKLLVGTGNSPQNGTQGDATGPSGLIKVDPDTGATKPYASGLSMGNGLVRGPDGSFYASNDFGSNIDRIRNGETERGWAKVDSGNGLVIDSAGTFLYAAQTFRPAAIARVDLANPGNVGTYVAADEADTSAGLDGLAIDAADNIYAAANGAGEIWKVPREADGTAGRPCLVLDDLPPFPDGPSAVAVGVGTGPFGAGNLYAVAFNGDVIEMPGVVVPFPAPRLALAVRPRRVRAGRRTRFRFTATVRDRGMTYPARGATVRFAGRSRVVNAAGTASMRVKLKRPGRKRARVSQGGVRSASAIVRIRRR